MFKQAIVFLMTTLKGWFSNVILQWEVVERLTRKSRAGHTWTNRLYMYAQSYIHQPVYVTVGPRIDIQIGAKDCDLILFVINYFLLSETLI